MADARQSAPLWTMPASSFVTIEYPGIVGTSESSLEKALSTLSPYVKPGAGMSSAPSALAHLAHILSLGGKLVECRLAPLPGQAGDQMQMFRHPLLGDVVPGNGLVLRIRRRVLQRRMGECLETRKVYTVELLGPISTTIRFRRMADFAFRPTMPAGASEHPTLALHRALADLDVDAMRAYRFSTDAQEYQVEEDTADGKCMRSNLAMIPPPLFSRMELPFAYGYRQNPASSLQTVPYVTTSKRSRRTARKGSGDADTSGADQRILTRYLNRSRWRNMAPIALKYSEQAGAPTAPESSLAVMPLSERHEALLTQLRGHLDERPVWSRLSLMNQLTVSDARFVAQAKELFALVAYTFADGPWRDTLVRFGYDPRVHVESRFLQRIHLRGKAPRTPTTRGVFKTEYGDVSHAGRAALQKGASPDGMRPSTHIFDGKHATTGWYADSAWDAIRSTISHRFHALLKDELNADNDSTWDRADAESSAHESEDDEDVP
ncbi:tau 95 subunit of transcription factor TFIIIC [Malassezia vespertilionis]|uniref:tau 95 subunit of transcription factor TFIIIC n=1 Tax=Malassezia vespertilionis TaxID=2020962 RepID=UPI0024B176E1|nr:tau 95 subunit of transcription factor TFIIIC [Malassezia vespertilionis]WFD05840.1 tau 95 subunit of transcription factor TFIIIC [Malassezia vespertilionis]